MVTESMVLRHAKSRSKALGLRFVRLSMARGVEAGWPDAFVLGPNGCILFMETKAPGKLLRPIQKERAKTLSDFGHMWCKPDTVEAVGVALAEFRDHCESFGRAVDEAEKALRRC